jgi:hypothetical protein
MSELTWETAIRRIAGSVSMRGQPDAQGAAREALTETLQDWDSRRDWRFTQVVAPDINIVPGDTTVTLPTLFKKPYVAYLVNNKTPLFYLERANWHRALPGYTSQSIPKWYTMFNEASTGTADIFPTCGITDTLVMLYYRPMTYEDGDPQFLDIPRRWEGYILHGAKALLTLGKGNQKVDRYFTLYEAGIKKAKEDDMRIPDQFVSFQPPDAAMQPWWNNPNSTWESVAGD